MDFEKQVRNIEKGKQIGYSIITEKVLLICGIQKNEEQMYLVYISSHDLEFDHMDRGNQEYYAFSSLNKAIEYIISRNFPFSEFAPHKGNKLFNINFFRKDNTVVIK